MADGTGSTGMNDSTGVKDRYTAVAAGHERAALQEALALPGYRLLRLAPHLEADYADNRRRLAIIDIRKHWRVIMLAIAMILLASFAFGLVEPRMRGLVLFGGGVVFALLAVMVAGAMRESLHPHIDTLVGVVMHWLMLGILLAASISPQGTDLRAISEYGVIFVMLAVFTISGLSFLQSFVAAASALVMAVLVMLASAPVMALVTARVSLPPVLEPVAHGFMADWQHFGFYGICSLLIASVIGVSREMRERTVFLQERLLVLEKRELDQLSRELTLISREDALTRLANRRHFDEVFNREWAGCLREGVSMNLLFIDVDYFKRYNDHYGHQAGDDVLTRVAAALATEAKRGPDFVARYGGEEFVAFFPRTNASGLKAIAQRMVEAVDELQIPHAKSDAASHVTISVGIAAFPPSPGESPETLLHAADAALYQAKQAGRHRYVAAWEPLQA